MDIEYVHIHKNSNIYIVICYILWGVKVQIKTT